MNSIKVFFLKWKSRIQLLFVVVVCLLPSFFLLKSNIKLTDDKYNLKDLLSEQKKTNSTIQLRLDTLMAHSVKLRLELELNDCKNYQIHEKIWSIPNDSLLIYADSLLSKPIPRKIGNFGTTAKKLLRIQRIISRPKKQSCEGECG